jgi:hypothetical protein
MAQIRIYLDGTFEATAGKYSFATDKERRDRIKVLQGDLKIMDKVEKLRVDREHNKKTIAGLKGPQKEKARAKDKEFLGKIKDLKAKLTSPRHNSSKLIGQIIRQTMDTVVGGKTIGQIAKEAGIKPGSKSTPKEQLAARQRKAVHGVKKAVEKEPSGSNAGVLKAAGVKLSALNAADKANVKKLAAMKDHQEMAEAVTLGEISPRGMGASGTVRNAGKLIAAHLKPEERATVDKISAQHEAALAKIRNNTGSPTRELRLNEKTQKKLNMSGIFDAHFYKPWTAINLINGITSVPGGAAKK